MTEVSEQEVERIAGWLSKPQRKALLWCPPDGTMREHGKGAPASVSLWCMADLRRGDPTKEVATLVRLVKRADGEGRRGRIWPEAMWGATSLGLAVRTYLERSNGPTK